MLKHSLTSNKVARRKLVVYQTEASKARPSCYVDDLSPRAQDLDLEELWVFVETEQHSLALGVLQELETIAKLVWSFILLWCVCILWNGMKQKYCPYTKLQNEDMICT